MSAAARVPPGQQLVAAGKWPPIGERQPRDDPAPWIVSVCGQAAQPRQFSLTELASLPQVERTIDIHCVTRWSKLDVRFGGVLLADVLAQCAVLPTAQYVSFVARSARGHSTSLPLADALSLDALLALSFEEQPLATIHGGPVRIVVPGRYFYKSLKWLERIKLLTDNHLGYWEAEAGYHNTADPWLEQRYIAPTLDRQEVQRRLAARDFSHRDLRGLSAADHNLADLAAQGALLRDADFRRANLQRANFQDANLSNAHFAGSDLREASFVGADLEGADFTSADLRGADLRGAALTAVSFVGSSTPPARIDASTRFDPSAPDNLMPLQADFLRKSLGLCTGQ